MDPDQQWLNMALEEYKALRTESLNAMGNQQATLRLGTGVIGVTIGLASNVQEDISKFFLFAVVIPAFTLIFFAMYAIEFARMARVGRYIEYVETEIDKVLPKSNRPSPLRWETWLSTTKRRGVDPRLPYYITIPATFGLSTVFSGIMAYSAGPFSLRWNIALPVLMCTLVLLIIGYISVGLMNIRNRYSMFFVPESPQSQGSKNRQNYK